LLDLPDPDDLDAGRVALGCQCLSFLFACGLWLVQLYDLIPLRLDLRAVAGG